jgi:hypothetical protein
MSDLAAVIKRIDQTFARRGTTVLPFTRDELVDLIRQAHALGIATGKVEAAETFRAVVQQEQKK